MIFYVLPCDDDRLTVPLQPFVCTAYSFDAHFFISLPIVCCVGFDNGQ